MTKFKLLYRITLKKPQISDILYLKGGGSIKKIKDLKSKLIMTVIYICMLVVFWALELPCFYKYFFHIPCPGCGMSHAFFELIKLNFKEALEYHPMIFFVPVLYLYFLFDGKLFKNKPLNFAVLYLILSGFLINYVLKMVF